MVYHFKHYFNLWGSIGDPRYDISDERKIEIAKEKAAKDLAKKLLEHSKFEVDECGNVDGVIYVGE